MNNLIARCATTPRGVNGGTKPGWRSMRISGKFQIKSIAIDLTCMNRILTVFTIVVSVVAISAQAPAPAKRTIASVTEKLQKIDGFMPLYVDGDNGKIYIEITRLNQEFLYLVSLPTGVGSNPLEIG